MKEEDAMVYRRPYLTSGSSGFALNAISRAMKKDLKVHINLLIAVLHSWYIEFKKKRKIIIIIILWINNVGCYLIHYVLQTYVDDMKTILEDKNWKVQTAIFWGQRDRWLSFDGVEDFCKDTKHTLVQVPTVKTAPSFAYACLRKILI